MTSISNFTALFILLFSFQGLACDTYRIREILRRGGSAEIDSTCSTYDARQLAEIGKDRLIVNLDGFSAYDARLIVEKGASFRLSKKFSTYDARRICQALVSPAVGTVNSNGFSDYDQRLIKEAGCRIQKNGALSFSEALRILRNGGYLEIKNEYSSYETLQLAQAGKNRLTVTLNGFSSYDARRIIGAGAQFNADRAFSTYDLRQMCSSLVKPAVGRVSAQGISDYDLRLIAQAGCLVVY